CCRSAGTRRRSRPGRRPSPRRPRGRAWGGAGRRPRPDPRSTRPPADPLHPMARTLAAGHRLVRTGSQEVHRVRCPPPVPVIGFSCICTCICTIYGPPTGEARMILDIAIIAVAVLVFVVPQLISSHRPRPAPSAEERHLLDG